jgi:hypothetical protein
MSACRDRIPDGDVNRRLSNWLGALFGVAFAFGASAQPVEVLPPDWRGAIQPQVAVAPNGNVFVAFGKDLAVYCTVSTDGAKTFRPPVKVATLPKLALGMRRGPRIVASRERVAISAISHQEGNLYVWTSDDEGKTWSQAATINSITNSVAEGLHAMAGDGRANLSAVWLDSRNRGKQLWGATSHDGGKTWGENVQIYQSPDGHICECCHPSVSISDDGRVRAMWRNWLKGSRDLYIAESADGGRSFSEARKLGAGTWPFNACPMDGGSLAGNYTAWMRAGGVYYTDTDSSEHLLDAHGRQPIVGIGKTGAYFIWQEDSRLMLKRGMDEKPVVLAADGAYPAAATVPENNELVVVWESGATKNIYAQVLR